MPNNITSFDIGESQVKVVTLSGGSVKKAVALELPDNVVSGGTVLSMDALADFLKEKLRASGPIKKDAAVILLPLRGSWLAVARLRRGVTGESSKEKTRVSRTAHLRKAPHP